MKKEAIITLPNPHLRNTSERVLRVDDATLKLVDAMTAAAIDWEHSRPHEISAALAAVQVDALQRIIIVRSNFDDKADEEFTPLINPEIVKYEGEIVDDYEGCLSVTNVYGKVPRYSKVRVKALNIHGEEIRFKADGFLARVLQHEIDHTRGIVFIDHIKDDTKAFFVLDDKGDLQPLDYDKNIKNNAALWS